MENKKPVYVIGNGGWDDHLGYSDLVIDEVRYKPECKVTSVSTDLLLADVYVRHWSTEDHSDMPITWGILQGRKISAYSKQSDTIFEITQEEYDAIAAEYNLKIANRIKNDHDEDLAEYRDIIATGDAIMQRTGKRLPTRKEARATEIRYNDINNEGGDGYVPHVLSQEEYDCAMQEVANG